MAGEDGEVGLSRRRVGIRKPKEEVEGSGQSIGCRGWRHMNKYGVAAGLRRISRTGAFRCHHPTREKKGWS